MPQKQPQKKPTRTIPHNLEAEQSVLGCVLYDNDTAADILAELKPEDFYSESHKFIFEAMQTVFNRNTPVDFVTLTDELESNGTLASVGGMPYLTTVSTGVPSAANFRHYMDIVKRDSVMRKLIHASNDIIEMAHSNVSREDIIGFSEKAVFDISAQSDTSQLTPIRDSVGTVIEKFDRAQSNEGDSKGLTTGLAGLDNALNGLHRTDLILIAARPAMGKTSLAMNIVENAATLAGATCAVFSLEMSKEQIAQRMLCSLAEVPMSQALRGQLKDDKAWARLWKTSAELEKSKIFIDDSTLITPAEMLSKCRRLKARYGLDLVMVDYIQLMTGGGRAESRQQEISAISRSLKILAKEVDVPVIALSQLSRAVESRASQRPQLSDLRESGAIEQDADIVMFIHRPDKVPENEQKVVSGEIPKNVAELIIAKHRNGALENIPLRFRDEYTKFVNMNKVADSIAEAYSGSIPPETVNTPLPTPPPADEETPW